MKFDALHIESNTEYCIVEGQKWLKLWLLHITFERKSIQYFVCGLEILLDPADWNLAHTRIMAMIRFKRLRFHKGNTTVLAIQTGIFCKRERDRQREKERERSILHRRADALEYMPTNYHLLLGYSGRLPRIVYQYSKIMKPQGE